MSEIESKVKAIIVDKLGVDEAEAEKIGTVGDAIAYIEENAK